MIPQAMKCVTVWLFSVRLPARTNLAHNLLVSHNSQPI